MPDQDKVQARVDAERAMRGGRAREALDLYTGLLRQKNEGRRYERWLDGVTDQELLSTKLALVDKVVYRTIKDEATFLTALRTGKLDILELIRWQNVEQLKKLNEVSKGK